MYIDQFNEHAKTDDGKWMFVAQVHVTRFTESDITSNNGTILNVMTIDGKKFVSIASYDELFHDAIIRKSSKILSCSPDITKTLTSGSIL